MERDLPGASLGLMMMTEQTSVLFVVNEIPDQAGTTRYQHAMALCESFETVIICKSDVPPNVRERAADVHEYPGLCLPDCIVLLSLWLLFWIVRVPSFVTVVSPHSRYLSVSYIGTTLSSSRLVVDFWDDLTLPIASYSEREGVADYVKELYHRILLTFGRSCLTRSDLLILSMHPGILEKYDLSSVKVVELTNGYSPELLDVEVSPRSDDRARFIYLGRANTKRGIDELIQMVATAAPSHHLDIIGPADTAVKRVADQFESVTLHGERPHKEAIELVARADVGFCILDTSVENYRYSYPIKIFEYAALGKAILASDTPAIRSVFRDGESAVLIDERDNENIRTWVSTLAEDNDLRQRLGETARKEVEDYSWPNILKLYTAEIGNQVIAASTNNS